MRPQHPDAMPKVGLGSTPALGTTTHVWKSTVGKPVVHVAKQISLATQSNVTSLGPIVGLA